METITNNDIHKIIKFGIVGASGTLINIITYYLLNKFGLGINISAVGAFCVAVTNNYLINHLWTFNDVNYQIGINFKYYIKYFVGNLFGLGANLIILNLILFFFGKDHYIVAQFIGILFGMTINFLFAKHFVFKNL